MIWTRDTFGGILMNDIGVSLNGVLIMIFTAIALRHAMARKIEVHQRWALRTFMAVSGVWFLRVIYAFLDAVPGKNSTFASLLLPNHSRATDPLSVDCPTDLIPSSGVSMIATRRPHAFTPWLLGCLALSSPGCAACATQGATSRVTDNVYHAARATVSRARADSLDEPTAAEAAMAMTMRSLPGAHDCDFNGVPDSLDVSAGRTTDLNHNGQDDVCDDDPAVRRRAWSEDWRGVASASDTSALLVRHAFGHEVWIRYTIPRGGSGARLTARAPSGAIVKTLRRGHLGSGAYDLIWDETDERGKVVHDSTTYTITLEVGRKTYTRPVFWRRNP